MKLSTRVRLLWHRLWIRKDEFDKSLDIDLEAIIYMDEKELEEYRKNLIHRRMIAHERDL